MQIRVDDLSSPQVIDLLRLHLRSVALHSPPESVHALDLPALRQPDITFWGVWQDAELMGCGALKELDARHGELKSMRTAPKHLRKGVAASLVRHMLAEAKHRGYQRLSLETGSMEAFAPARSLYARFGFIPCGPFADYVDDPFSVFMTREVQGYAAIDHLLNNIAWHTLTGPHASYATGADGARRYAPGYSPIMAFADVEHPDFGALAPFCEPGDHIYCDGWAGAAPAGWRVVAESTMFKMVWASAIPAADEMPDAVRLAPEHVAQALALTTLTRPGPFGPKTIELGEYYGCFEGERLVAMAGERMHAGPLREISGVCTHPDFQGRGLARRLVAKLIRRQMERDEVPFLHVMTDNRSAHELYQRMGFRDQQEAVVRLITACR